MTHHLDELMRLHDEACDAECEYREALRIDVGAQAAGMKSGLADTALRTAIAKALDEARGAWQPISTAPRDETVVLLAGGTWADDDFDFAAPQTGVMAARWRPYVSRGVDYSAWAIASTEAGHSLVTYDNPTHWQPLPPAPTQPATAGKEQ
jgi:hypothetical protein